MRWRVAMMRRMVVLVGVAVGRLALGQEAHCVLIGAWGSGADTTDGIVEPMVDVDQPVGRSAMKSEVLDAAVYAASEILGVPKSIDRDAGLIETAEWYGKGLVYDCTVGNLLFRITQYRRYWARILVADGNVLVSPHCLAAAGGKGHPEAEWDECARGVPSGSADMKIFRALAQTSQMGAEIKATERLDRIAAERRKKPARPKTK
jgi:hypothetical protein